MVLLLKHINFLLIEGQSLAGVLERKMIFRGKGAFQVSAHFYCAGLMMGRVECVLGGPGSPLPPVSSDLLLLTGSRWVGLGPLILELLTIFFPVGDLHREGLACLPLGQW